MRSSMSSAEIEALLSRQTLGHLGCCTHSKPYIYPMAYVYHEDVIYGQTIEGKKIEILRSNPSVCFQVQDIQDDAWQSAECWGTFEELDFSELNGEDAQHVVGLLNSKLGVIQEQVGIHINFILGEEHIPKIIEGREATLFRIVVHEKTGQVYTHDDV